MGLSALDCPRCGRWDDDGEYPTCHGSRAIEVVEVVEERGYESRSHKVRKEYTDICDKCFKELVKAGGKVFYMKEVVTYEKVYGKDPKVEYGSSKHVQCSVCYYYYDPKTNKSCPRTNSTRHKQMASEK